MHKNDFSIKIIGVFFHFFVLLLNIVFLAVDELLQSPGLRVKPPTSFKGTVFISYCTEMDMRSSRYVITVVDSS